jgi:hypothetical protein
MDCLISCLKIMANLDYDLNSRLEVLRQDFMTFNT